MFVANKLPLMKRCCGPLLLVALASGNANAQSINISFGHASGGPSAGYAAAGASGVWNSITGVAGSSFSLAAIDGSPSGVSVSQSPTTTVLTTPDPSVSGDDAKLLNSGLVTTGAETCLSFVGFKPGTYEVLVYAWLPNHPTIKSRTRQDQAPSTIDVGGAWSGTHAEAVTYARYVVTVDSSGSLPAHSGLVPGAPMSALNGVQIRPLSTVARDAGTMLGADASDMSSHDSGSPIPDSDAGAMLDDAGVTSSPDTGSPRGVAPNRVHTASGCSTAGGDVNVSLCAFVALALSLALLRRRWRSGTQH
jgi:hypothetical protein